MKGEFDMKKYINATAEIYKLDVGDVMLLTSVEVFSFSDFKTEDPETEGSKHYKNWGNWNS